jgi:thiol-disulfide isomerase/thioredoxin
MPELPSMPASVSPRLRRRVLVGLAAAAGLSGAGFSWWRARERNRERQQEKEAVSLFFQQVLPDSNGAVFAFEQMRGSQVVANFWATWCAPCVEEMPELSALATELQGTGTRFVGVGVDNPDAIARFSSKLPVSYPLVVANATGAFLAARFGNNAGGLPYTVVIAPDGRVKTQILGRVRIDSLREVIKSSDLR